MPCRDRTMRATMYRMIARAYIAPMNTSDCLLFTAYRLLENHWYRFQPRNAAVSSPASVMSGMPRTLYRAIGEFLNSSFFRHGRMIAAIAVPKNVIAMTSVASRMNVAN